MSYSAIDSLHGIADSDPNILSHTLYIRDPQLYQVFKECVAILDTKGNDYTVGQADKDRLYNFRSAAKDAGVSIVQVWYVYFFKHLTSLQRFVKEGRVESEPIEGRINDLINYLALLRLIIMDQQKEHKNDNT